MSVVVKEAEFNLTCSLKNAVNFIGLVLFSRESRPSNYDHYLNQITESICTSSTNITICGRGTNNSYSYEKLYIMMFKAPSSGDEGKWWCTINDTKVISNTYTIKLKSEFLCLFIDISSV